MKKFIYPRWYVIGVVGLLLLACNGVRFGQVSPPAGVQSTSSSGSSSSGGASSSGASSSGASSSSSSSSGASGSSSGGTGTPQTVTMTVTPQNNQLDMLLIIDDSNSMLGNSQKLATNLHNLTSQLTSAGFDWQMCVTITNAQQISESDPTLYWGASIDWVGNTNSVPYILTPNVANPQQVFMNTINDIGAGWANTEDERGIKAAYWHLWNGDPSVSGASGCYRPNAGIAVVLISNEDVRSIGGNKAYQYYPDEYFPLDNDDLPTTYLSYVQEIFGPTKRLSFNSILVKPGDATCMATQDAMGSKSHAGYNYSSLSNMTNGYVGSICDSDYSSNLNYFKNQIVTAMNSLILQCAPVGTPQVSLTPTMNVTTTVVGQNLVFNPALPVGTTVTVNYQCP